MGRTYRIKNYIALLLLFFISLGAAAQNSQMTYKRGNLYIDGTVINTEMIESIIGSQVFNDTYLGAVKQRNTARKLCISGLSFMAGGLTANIMSRMVYSDVEPDVFYYDGTLSVPVNSTSEILKNIGKYAFYIGAASVSIGLPLYFIGNSRLKWIAKDYNQHNTPVAYVQLGVQQHGFGLSVNF